jgi:hypothetical protein
MCYAATMPVSSKGSESTYDVACAISRIDAARETPKEVNSPICVKDQTRHHQTTTIAASEQSRLSSNRNRARASPHESINLSQST